MTDNTKPTNPKDAIGSSKVPVSVLSAQVLGEVGLAMLEGACKYRRHNYRVSGVRASVYYDAVMARHMPAWWEGQDIDPASGLSHITKAIASLMVLRDAMLQENFVDDRPPRAKNQNWVEDQNKLAEAVLARFPEPKMPCTQKELDDEAVTTPITDAMVRACAYCGGGFLLRAPGIDQPFCSPHCRISHDREIVHLIKNDVHYRCDTPVTHDRRGSSNLLDVTCLRCRTYPPINNP